MFKEFKPAFMLLLVFTLLTGAVYPALVTLLAQTLFPQAANGSLIVRDGKILGSELIGQPFSNTRYFWGRPSATSPMPYNAAASAGSNLGPTNPALAEAIKARIAMLHASDPAQHQAIPVDLVTSSASGLDPDISPAAAAWQLPRVARARGLDADAIARLVQQHTQGRIFGVLGEPRVKVLALNLALDKLAQTHAQ
jgi:K+-transporting ATPase ATPase C chain